MPPLNDNFRARQRGHVRPQVAREPERPAPFFRGLTFGLLAELAGAALIFAVAYLYWLVLP